jgi:hypothetical protein
MSSPGLVDSITSPAGIEANRRNLNRSQGTHKQDLHEGIVCWKQGRPYLTAHNENGTCCHLDPSSWTCAVWEQRRIPCQGFDYRADDRIRLDFENGGVNPEIDREDWLQCLVHDEWSASS